jgi:hypothetical protein
MDEHVARSVKLRRFNHAPLQFLACFLCVLFGLAMIANTQPAGDGTWFWYAVFFHGGKHLYADMHLALQPVFVLETSYAMSLFGKSWLASKIPAVVHLCAYSIALLLLVRRSRGSDLQKALLLGCAFFVSLCFEAYRFDDYHVLTDCFQLYSLVLVLAFQRLHTVRRTLLLAACLGVLSGLAIETRLNDGAALAVGIAIAILCFAPTRRWTAMAIFATTVVVTAIAVVGLTGDSLHSYAYYSILHAAGEKGGAGSVLTYPLHLPFNTLRWLRPLPLDQLLLDALAAAAAWGFLVFPVLKDRSRAQLLKAALGLILIFLELRLIREDFWDVEIVMSFSALGVLLLYACGVVVTIRFLRWMLSPAGESSWNRREILLLTPLGQLASGSMSSGGVHMGLYAPIGVFIALLPIASPIRIKSKSVQAMLLGIATMMMVNGAIYKTRIPFSWHTYHEKRMFQDRVWFRHPDYGPMLIDRDLLEMIQPACQQVKASGQNAGLLSLPYPYANYFCDIPPWHGYVQTFFDTSSKETISTLMEELETAPPEWIFYQRQLATLKLHEDLYNQGKPLQHRYLDAMIQRKLNQGTWQATYRSNYDNSREFDNEWILIHTRKEKPLGDATVSFGK